MICAIQQAAGSTTINGGTISTPNYRSVRINGGSLTVTGGTFDGQVWLQPNQDNATIAVSGGTFEPNGGDASAIYMTNNGEKYTVTGASFEGGTFNGKIGCADATKLAGCVKGGKFTEAAKNGTNATLIAEGYVFDETDDGYFALVHNPAYGKVAKVGENYYETFAAAVATATAGQTITLLQDVAENVTVSLGITIDGNGKTFTGKITSDKNNTVTIKNVNFNGNSGAVDYAVRNDNGSIVIENCTATGYGNGLLYANKSNNKLTVKNSTISDCNGFGIHLVSFNNAYLNGVAFNNVKYGVVVQNAGVRNVEFNGCTMENVETPVYVWEKGTGSVNVTFKGENDFGAVFSLGKYAVINGAVLGGTKVYPSLTEAIAVSDDIKLIANTTGAGAVINKSLTFDLCGYAYTVNKAVGSKGTETLGLQLLGGDVVLKNGTLTSTTPVVEGSKEVRMLINNYTNLTVEDMNLVDNTGLLQYVLSNNSGTVSIKGVTNITATGENVAFDACKYASYAKPDVTVNTTGKITGKVEVTGGDLAIMGGTFTVDVTEWCAAGYVCLPNEDGTFGIVFDPNYGKVAQVGENKYASIQAAVDAAQNGDIVTLIADVTIGAKNTVVNNHGYAVLVNVSGKKVTIDLNGMKVTVDAKAGDLTEAKDAMLMAVFHADTNGELVLTDNSEDKDGAVVVNVNDAKVYSVFASESKFTDKAESGKIIVNAGNYSTVGKLANAMFFADADEVITVNGGNFYCDGATTGTPYPWIINTLGNDNLQVVVKGGTFNVELNKQHRYKEIEIPDGYVVVNNGDGTWTVKGAVAVLNGVGYLTFDEAYADAKTGDVIELLQTVVITNSKPWINYSKKQITVNAEFGDVAFHIQDGAYVWFGGMTVNSNDYCFIVGAKDGSSGATVEFNGGTYNGATSVVSVTKGEVNIMGGTFKAEPYEGSYAYTINCNDANYKAGTADVAIKGGKFYNYNPANNAAEGAGTNFLVARYAASEDAEGWWTVAEAVAQVGNAYFATLAEAVEAAQANDVVTLVKNVTGHGVVINKNVTINFNEKIYTVNKGVGSKGTETLGLQILKGNTVTLENGTLTSEGENILMLVQNYADLTVRDMHLDGSNLNGTGRYVLSNNSGNVVVEGATDITAKAGDFAFDACKYADYEAPTVTVETTGKIAGKIEETGGNLVIKGGTYDMNVNEWCDDYCTSKPNADGTYNVVAGVTLVDGKFTEYTLSENMEVEYIRYQRSLGTAWNTMYLPFEIPMSMLIEKYEIAYINDIRQSDTNADGEIDKLVVEHVLIKDADATLLANYPYLIRPKTAEDAELDLVFDEGAMLYAAVEISLDCSSIGTYYKFTGNAHKMNADELKDKYAMSKSGEWKHSFSSMSPFRVYFSIETRPGSHIKISKNLTIVSREYGEEGTTGVDSINSELGEGMIFDLQGRRVLETEKGGIYIKGGKKFIAQ